MDRQRRSGQTSEAILDAAEAVIRRDGAARLTIDAVAAEAGLSKGGVLHHFASKDVLIVAMVTHQLRLMDDELAAIEAALPQSHLAPLVALTRYARAHYVCEDGIPKALLVASAENPKALEGFRAKIAETLGRLEVSAAERGAGALGTPALGIPALGAPALGAPAVLLFAVLGLLLTKSLGFFAFGDAEIAALLDRLEGMAMAEMQDPTGASGPAGREG